MTGMPCCSCVVAKGYNERVSPFAFFSLSGTGNLDVDVIVRSQEHFPRVEISKHE